MRPLFAVFSEEKAHTYANGISRSLANVESLRRLYRHALWSRRQLHPDAMESSRVCRRKRHHILRVEHISNECFHISWPIENDCASACRVRQIGQIRPTK